MKLQQQLVAGHGGMAQLIIDADLVGIKITEAFNWKDPEAFKNIVSELDQKTQLLNSAMQEYGFTWEDLGDKARGAKLSQLFDDLYAKTDILRTAGIDYRHDPRAPGRLLFEAGAVGHSHRHRNPGGDAADATGPRRHGETRRRERGGLPGPQQDHLGEDAHAGDSTR